MMNLPINPELKDLIIGLDVGGRNDRTVLALLERIQDYGEDPFQGRNRIGKPYYILKYLDRFKLDIPTPQQVDKVKRTYERIIDVYNKDLQSGQAKIKPYLIVDLGNVGRAHFDEYLQSGMNVYGINYLGDGATSDRTPNRNIYGVAKIDLASALSVLLENGRFIIPDRIKERKTLIQELSKFTWKRTEAGNLTVENLRDSDHDDIVCSLMVAAWYGEHGIRELLEVPKGFRAKLGL